MALSNGYDTVSSWLQPPSAAVIAADEKLKMSNQEFEKLAFRPARMGVGAAAPTASTSKEIYKLKHKLAGTKRKADEIDSPNGKGKGKADPEEDDDEESKTKSIIKKPKLGGTSALLAFEPGESATTHNKKKKKKKDKGRLDPATVASPENGALPPSGAASSSISTVISERNASSPSLAEGTARENREGSMAESAEALTAPDEPEALPADISEKKQKKKKKQKKSTEDDHGSKSKLRPSPSSGGDGNKGEDQGDWEDDGEEWSGIPPSQPPPGSDMGPPPPPKPPKPTSAPSPDLKSTTVSDSRINHDGPPRPPKPPKTPATQLTTRSTSSIPSSSRSSGSIISSPPQNGRTGVGSHPLTSSSLPTLPNGDSSSPHKKKKKRRRALLDQAQALDEQSSEATLVSSSDHTARMTSPRE